MKKGESVAAWQEEIDSDLKAIGENLKVIRQRAGETKEIFCEWFGVVPDTIYKYEKGTGLLKAAHLCLLAEKLKINVEDIICRDLQLDVGIDYSLGYPLKSYLNYSELIDSYNDRIARNIRNVRNNKQLTRKQLVKKLGWNEKRLYRIETTSSHKTWKKSKSLIVMAEVLAIAKALEVPVEQLFAHCTKKKYYTVVMDNPENIPVYSF